MKIITIKSSSTFSTSNTRLIIHNTIKKQPNIFEEHSKNLVAKLWMSLDPKFVTASYDGTLKLCLLRQDHLTS